MPIDYGIQVPQVQPVQQPNMLAQMQMVGLMRQMQQQNALRDILQQSGGQIDDNVLARLYSAGAYEPANAISNTRRQNMLLDVTTRAKNLDMEATRLGMRQTGAQIEGVGLENRARAVRADEAESDAVARKGVYDFIKTNQDISNPEALEGLRKTNPQAYMSISKQIAEMQEIKAKAQKEGALSAQARTQLANSTADLLSPLLPSVNDQTGYTAVYSRIAALDPTVAGVIGPEYTPQNMRALSTRLQDLKDIEYKEDAFGRLYKLHKRTGETTLLTPTPKPEGAPYGELPPKLQVEAMSSDIKQKAAAAEDERKAETAKTKELPGVQSAARASIDSLDQQMRDIDDLLKRPGRTMVTGPVFGRSFVPSSVVPGDPFGGAGAQAIIDKIKAQSGLSALQELRKNSPTGGALGNVSNQEGLRLENSAAALAQTQDTKDFDKQLRQYKKDLQLAKQRIAEAYKREYGVDMPAELQNSRVAGAGAARKDPLTVVTPNGAEYKFPDKAAADQFYSSISKGQ